MKVRIAKSIGRSCQHPTGAARWDEHRALLRCTSCGRKIEDGAQRRTGVVPCSGPGLPV